jgi:hypothetical protein
MTGMDLGGVAGCSGISSSEMSSVSGKYEMGNLPDGGALAGSV